MPIRSFECTDREAVIDLWARCNLLRPWNDPALDILRKQSVGADLFLVGLIEQKIVACVMGGYDGHRGWMNYLAVSPDCRKRGLGRRIVEELEHRLKAVGCPKLNLQVRSDNDLVAQFYTSMGYVNDEVVSFGKRLIHDLPRQDSPG